jgi:hypothetical protein
MTKRLDLSGIPHINAASPCCNKIDLYHFKDSDKYVDFLEQYPTLPNRFAQHYIASYLGMTPEFLSKIRKNFHLNNPYFYFLF